MVDRLAFVSLVTISFDLFEDLVRGRRLLVCGWIIGVVVVVVALVAAVEEDCSFRVNTSS